MRTVHNALYKSISQDGLIVWVGCTASQTTYNTTKSRYKGGGICLNSNNLIGLSVYNYTEFILYKQFVILSGLKK